MEDREINVVTSEGVVVRYPGGDPVLDLQENTLTVFNTAERTKAVFNWNNVAFYSETGSSV